MSTMTDKSEPANNMNKAADSSPASGANASSIAPQRIARSNPLRSGASDSEPANNMNKVADSSPASGYKRMRRLRSNAALRGLVQETHIRIDKLIYPMFVIEGSKKKVAIDPMPGIYQQSVDEMLKEVAEIVEEGIKAVILFGIPENKDSEASGAWRDDGIVQKATRAIKQNFPSLLVVADTCLCEYMDHGHCGVVHEGRILNDPSVRLLARTAVSQAAAGADVIAPSDMMDGRVKSIRTALDEADFEDIPILAYSAKFASAFYGPFRVAAQSAPQFGDRSSYQMDPPNGREALREIELDLEEGADMVMIKPAMPNLDIIREARYLTNAPIGAYNVSGEYAMVKAAAAKGWIDERRVVLESLTGIFRAGADFILTYHARNLSHWLK
jgi:porphobilinogen synthase